VNGQDLTKKMLEKIYSVLLPYPPRNPDRSGKADLALPSICRLETVKINGKTVSAPVRPFGSVQWVKLPLEQLKPGEEAEAVIDFRKNAAKNIIPAIAFPNGNHIYLDRPSDWIDFMKYMHAESVYSLLHNTYGFVYYAKAIPGAIPKINPNYKGDFLQDFLTLAKENGITLNGGFYFSFSKIAKDKTKPTRIGKDGKPFKNGIRVCLLDEKVREQSLASLRQMLKDYPGIDRLELDDNFEMDGKKSCYCARCLEKFHQEYPGKQAGPDSPEWDRFWRHQGEILLQQVLKITRAAGKKLNGARKMWVEEGNTHSYLSRHCAMIYEFPAFGCSEGIRVLPERGAYSTILWGMERDLKEIDKDVREAVFGGSVMISYWLHFFRRKDADNRWGVGTPQNYEEMKLPNGRLLHGTFEAVSRAYSRLEDHFRDYLAQYLLQGDSRYTVTKAVMDDHQLRVTIRNTGKLTSAVTGPVDFSEFFRTKK
ncbi:MAG: hypothetical protein J5858_11575, partial [Lentisphaeria bacterium]|nr:hypothetical protein [Lentisphaeria bacterium]